MSPKFELFREEIFPQVKNLLKEGRTIGLPTETVYGLACDATSPKACLAMQLLKERDPKKAFSIFVGETDTIETLAIVTEEVKHLITSLMPGPITIILNAKDGTTFQSQTLGIRIPDHATTRRLLQYLTFPLAVTSANMSGEPALLSAHDTYSIFKDNLACYLDDPNLIVSGQASTVVSLLNPKYPVILREGPISLDTIKTCLGIV